MQCNADAHVRIWSVAPVLSAVAELGEEGYRKIKSALPPADSEVDTVTGLASDDENQNDEEENGKGGDTDTKAPRCLAKLVAHTATVNVVRWSHGGRFLATGSADGLINVWELRPEATKSSMFGMTSDDKEEEELEVWCKAIVLGSGLSEIEDLSWSPCDTKIACVTVDGTMLIWELRDAIISLNSTYNLYCDDAVYKQYDKLKPKSTKDTVFISSSVILMKAHDWGKGISWDPMGTYIATSGNDNSVAIWRIENGACVLEERITRPYEKCRNSSGFRRLEWSPDGTSLVTPSGMTNSRYVAPILSRQDGSVTANLLGHQNAVGVCRCASKLLVRNKGDRDTHVCCALGDNDGIISFWQTDRPAPFAVVKGAFSGHVADLAWGCSASGQTHFLLACALDGTVACMVLPGDELGVVAGRDNVKNRISSLYGSHVFDKILRWEFTARVLSGFNIVNDYAKEVAIQHLSSRQSNAVNNLKPFGVSNLQSSSQSVLKTQQQETKGGKKRIIPQSCNGPSDTQPGSPDRKRARLSTLAVKPSIKIKKMVSWIYAGLANIDFGLHKSFKSLDTSMDMDTSGKRAEHPDGRKGTVPTHETLSGSLIGNLPNCRDLGVIGPKGIPVAVEPFLAQMERSAEAQAQGIAETDPFSNEEENGESGNAIASSSCTLEKGNIRSSQDVWQALQTASMTDTQENDNLEHRQWWESSCILCPPPRRLFCVFYLQAEKDTSPRWCLESRVFQRPTVHVDSSKDIQSSATSVPVTQLQLVDVHHHSILWRALIPAEVCSAAVANIDEDSASPTFVVIGCRNGLVCLLGSCGERLLPSAALGTPVSKITIHREDIRSENEYTCLLGLERYKVAALGCDGFIRMWTVMTLKRSHNQHEMQRLINLSLGEAGETPPPKSDPWSIAYPRCLFRMFVSKAEVLEFKSPVLGLLSEVRQSSANFSENCFKSSQANPDLRLNPFYGALVDEFRMTDSSQPVVTIRAQKFTLGRKGPSRETSKKPDKRINFTEVMHSLRRTYLWCSSEGSSVGQGVQAPSGLWQDINQSYTLAPSAEDRSAGTTFASLIRHVTSLDGHAQPNCPSYGALWLPQELHFSKSLPNSLITDTPHSVHNVEMQKELVQTCDDTAFASLIETLHNSSRNSVEADPTSTETEWSMLQKLTLVEETLLRYETLTNSEEYKRL